MNATTARTVIPLFARRIRCVLCGRTFRTATCSDTVDAYLGHQCTTRSAS